MPSATKPSPRSRQIGAVGQAEGDEAHHLPGQPSDPDPAAIFHTTSTSTQSVTQGFPARPATKRWDGQIDEREGGAVVEAGFGCQREAVSSSSPERAGRPGCRWREPDRSAPAPRRGAAPAWPPPARAAHRPSSGEGGNGRRHGDAEQPPGQDPAPPGDFAIQLQPSPHQRDDDDEFGEALDQAEVFLRMGHGPGQQRARSERSPDADANDRQRQRRPVQHHRQPGSRSTRQPKPSNSTM